MKKRLFAAIVILCLLAGAVCVGASAQEAAQDISGAELVSGSYGFPSEAALFDGAVLSGAATGGNAGLTLEYDSGMGSLYFLFDIPYGEYTVTDNDTQQVYQAGTNGFLHEFVDLEAAFGHAPTSVSIDFARGSVKLYELYVYTPGQVPDSVQKWLPPVDGQTDLVLFSTHGDDEQLFFAGLLPYYAGEMGYQVQVVYMTDHREGEPYRIHEMLNGLWAVGVTAYPVAGSFPDFRQDSLEDTYDGFAYRGYSREDLMAYVVENLRRFKPLVAVGHDINGEYGHGMHMVYTDLLMDAVEIASDERQYPESAKTYGTWDTPKTYLHLYSKNKIVMDWDQPLEHFGGMTAFQVTQKLGFPCHESQYTAFAWYHSYEKSARDVSIYSPCEFGLFRTTVGEDVQKKDFFENLTTYGEQARLREERHKAAQQLVEGWRKEQQAQSLALLEQLRNDREALESSAAPVLSDAAALAASRNAARNGLSKNLLLPAAVAAVVLAGIAVLLALRTRRKRYKGAFEK